MRVLVVEDEATLAAAVARGLRRQGKAVARRLSEQTLHERIGLHGPRDEQKEPADSGHTSYVVGRPQALLAKRTAFFNRPMPRAR